MKGKKLLRNTHEREGKNQTYSPNCIEYATIKKTTNQERTNPRKEDQKKKPTNPTDGNQPTETKPPDGNQTTQRKPAKPTKETNKEIQRKNNTKNEVSKS